MRWAVMLAVLLLASGSADAQQNLLSSPSQVRTFADKIMVLIGAGEYDRASAVIRQVLVVPLAEFDAEMSRYKAGMPAFQEKYGKPLGYEFLREAAAGESLVNFVYISKFERTAMYWSFAFYRGPSGWLLLSFDGQSDVAAVFR